MANSGLTSGYAPSAGTKLYFEMAGAGDPIVFIHAGVADGRMWDPQFDLFARNFRVIRYDHRGFGKSAMGEGPYSLREDLHSVLKFLDARDAVLVGCSMGGSTAIDFTLEHPELVRGLVPVGAGLGGFGWSEESIKQWGAMMKLVQERDVDRARELDACYWIDGPDRDAALVDPVYRERARHLHRENFSLERLAHPEVELKPPAIGRLREIKCPTSVVIGDSDAADLIKVAHLLAAEIPGVSLATIQNAAHLPSLEHPEEFNSLLQSFLSRLPW